MELDIDPNELINGTYSINVKTFVNLNRLERLRDLLRFRIVQINNEGYLSIKLTQESFFKGQEFASGPKTGVTLPSMEKLSSAFLKSGTNSVNGLNQILSNLNSLK